MTVWDVLCKQRHSLVICDRAEQPSAQPGRSSSPPRPTAAAWRGTAPDERAAAAMPVGCSDPSDGREEPRSEMTWWRSPSNFRHATRRRLRLRVAASCHQGRPEDPGDPPARSHPRCDGLPARSGPSGRQTPDSRQEVGTPTGHLGGRRRGRTSGHRLSPMFGHRPWRRSGHPTWECRGRCIGRQDTPRPGRQHGALPGYPATTNVPVPMPKRMTRLASILGVVAGSVAAEPTPGSARGWSLRAVCDTSGGHAPPPPHRLAAALLAATACTRDWDASSSGGPGTEAASLVDVACDAFVPPPG